MPIFPISQHSYLYPHHFQLFFLVIGGFLVVHVPEGFFVHHFLRGLFLHDLWEGFFDECFPSLGSSLAIVLYVINLGI